MRVLIIGCGRMGRGVAVRLLSGGHALTLFDVDPAASERLESDMGGLRVTDAKIAIAETPGEAIPHSDVVILASSYGANLEIARDLSASLDGTIVVDISNPLNDTHDGLITAPGTSAAESIRAVLPNGAKVVKAFNTTFANTLIVGSVASQRLDVFIAGDDQAANDTVATLVRSGGLNAIDTGPLKRARELEAIGFLGITLQARLGTAFGTAWKLVIPPTH